MDVEYVTNPTTNRPVRIGGRVYKQLVRNGMIESMIESTHVAESTLDKNKPNDKKFQLSDFEDEVEYY